MGKSLNMSMLKKFLDVREAEGSGIAFSGLLISEDAPFCKQHMNSYPLISIKLPKSLLRIKSVERWQENLKEYFCELTDQFFESPIRHLDTMTPHEILNKIIDHLWLKTGKEVIILIDNYDYPLLAALKGKIIKPATEFYKLLFPSSLLTNQNVRKIVVAGLLRLEIPETIFSQGSLIECLNQKQNLQVCSQPHFGISDAEVDKLMQGRNISQSLIDKAKSFYRGFSF